MTNATVVAGGGRANNRVPSKRYGMPAVSVVEMDEVPEPCHRDAGIAGPLYAQIAELKDGALKVGLRNRRARELCVDKAAQDREEGRRKFAQL